MSITVHKLHDAVNKNTNINWIDVRTSDEFAQDRPNIACLKNHPLSEVPFLSLPKTAYIYVSCLSGKRSQIAKEILIKLGYTNVINVTGGFLEWKSAGFPVKSSIP